VNRDGECALFHALRSKCVAYNHEILWIILEAGPDTNILTKENESVCDLETRYCPLENDEILRKLLYCGFDLRLLPPDQFIDIKARVVCEL
jgi:hypothetical protein